jgi:hypothetical protein
MNIYKKTVGPIVVFAEAFRTNPYPNRRIYKKAMKISLASSAVFLAAAGLDRQGVLPFVSSLRDAESAFILGGLGLAGLGAAYDFAQKTIGPIRASELVGERGTLIRPLLRRVEVLREACRRDSGFESQVFLLGSLVEGAVLLVPISLAVAIMNPDERYMALLAPMSLLSLIPVKLAYRKAKKILGEEQVNRILGRGR